MSKDLLPENIHIRDNVVMPMLNEILRRHDHAQDAHILDAKLIVDWHQQEIAKARQSELEMFKKIPIELMSREVASHISRRYSELSQTLKENKEK